MENFSLQVISSVSLFIISFFFIFWIGSYFEMDIFPLENRSTNYSTFHSYIFDKYVDSIIISLLTIFWLCLSIRGKIRIVSAIIYGSLAVTALLTNFDPLLDAIVLGSIPIIVSFFVFHHFSPKKIISIQTNLFMSFFSFAVLCIAISGLITTLVNLSSNFVLPARVPYPAFDIFLLFSSFSIGLLILLVAGSIVKLLTFNKNTEFNTKKEHFHISHKKIKQKTKFLFLSLFMLLAIFVALLPHQSFINNENLLVGADTANYVIWLENIISADQNEYLHSAFVVQNSGDRPLSLMLFSAVFLIFPDNPSQGIEHIPIILSPVLVLSVFFLTRELTSNDTVSLLASFLTAISFQPLIAINSGIYANFLALIIGYASIVFLLRFLKKPTGISYLAFFILLFLLMFSHIYTWTLLALFLGIFLIVTGKLKIFERKRIALVLLIIGASVAFDAGKSILTDSVGGIESDLDLFSTRASYVNIFSIWETLFQTSHVFAGGQFGNFLILSLCIFWLLRSNFREIPNLFMAIFLSIAILPILFGDDVIQSRVFYNISFQIPAAIGLFYLSNQHRGNLLVFAICIWILAMSIQAISNFI